MYVFNKITVKPQLPKRIDKLSKIADKNKTVQTVALPVSNKVIVLDAGHRETR